MFIHRCVAHESEANISRKPRHSCAFHILDRKNSSYSDDNRQSRVLYSVRYFLFVNKLPGESEKYILRCFRSPKLVLLDAN